MIYKNICIIALMVLLIDGKQLHINEQDKDLIYQIYEPILGELILSLFKDNATFSLVKNQNKPKAMSDLKKTRIRNFFKNRL